MTLRKSKVSYRLYGINNNRLLDNSFRFAKTFAIYFGRKKLSSYILGKKWSTLDKRSTITWYLKEANEEILRADKKILIKKNKDKLYRKLRKEIVNDEMTYNDGVHLFLVSKTYELTESYSRRKANHFILYINKELKEFIIPSGLNINQRKELIRETISGISQYNSLLNDTVKYETKFNIIKFKDFLAEYRDEKLVFDNEYVLKKTRRFIFEDEENLMFAPYQDESLKEMVREKARQLFERAMNDTNYKKFPRIIFRIICPMVDHHNNLVKDYYRDDLENDNVLNRNSFGVSGERRIWNDLKFFDAHFDTLWPYYHEIVTRYLKTTNGHQAFLRGLEVSTLHINPIDDKITQDKINNHSSVIYNHHDSSLDLYSLGPDKNEIKVSSRYIRRGIFNDKNS